MRLLRIHRIIALNLLKDIFEYCQEMTWRKETVMRIGIAGPFNPYCVADYFDKDTSLPNVNITASSVNTYVRALLEKGHDIVVFTTDSTSDRTKVYIGKNITIYCLHNRFKIRGFTRYRMHGRIRNCVKRELNNLDILHAEWTYEYAYALLPFVSIKPVFCSVRDWCPYLLTLAKGRKEQYYWKMSYYMFKKVMKENRVRFIANSDYTYKSIKDAYPQNNVDIIPNPIQRSFIREQRDDYPEKPVFVSISQSIQNIRKNYKTLLKAFQQYLVKHPDARLILIGWYSEEWKASMDEEQLLRNVELKGSMNHDEIFEVLDKSSCMIHPSLEETFGNILLEAMCRRIPCIGGEASGAVPQVLGFGKYGLLCDITNPSSIVSAMEEVSKLIAPGFADRCTKYLLDTYADNVVADMHLALFNAALRLGGDTHERE